MTRRFYILFVATFVSIMLLGLASAACSLDAQIINQDPYPAIPGDYVKVVFQVTGVENQDCGIASFELQPGFPFSLDPGTSTISTLKTGTYAVDYKNSWIIPYKVRVDKDAIDGDNVIRVRYAYNTDSSPVYISKDFNLSVNESKTDFDVILNDYSQATHVLTLGIVNIGKVDASALTVQIPTQQGVNLSSGNEKVIGTLKSKGDTSVSFSGIITSDNVQVLISYTDLTGARRTVAKEITLDQRMLNEAQGSVFSKVFEKWVYGLVGLLIGIILSSMLHRAHAKHKENIKIRK